MSVASVLALRGGNGLQREREGEGERVHQDDRLPPAGERRRAVRIGGGVKGGVRRLQAVLRVPIRQLDERRRRVLPSPRSAGLNQALASAMALRFNRWIGT